MRRFGLTYHDVVPPATRDDSGFVGPGPDRYKVSPDSFRAQLDALAAAGLAPGLFPAARLALTFDDGGVSAADTVVPLLAERGWRAYFFVVADRIGARGFLDAAGCRDLARAGHLVGSHGLSHRPLTSLADAELAEEWTHSRELLAAVLGADVSAGSVPRGFYDVRVGRAAAAAGYTQLFTSEPWLEPRAVAETQVYGRFAVLATTPAARVVALAAASPSAIVPAAAAWQARKAAKRALGPGYERLRSALVAKRH
jgi:peptidoglycan/xylan/chitin deacetylase (PgdA/CDA1 family)